MPDKTDDKEERPKVLLLSETKVDDVLKASATAMAMNINSETMWKKDTSVSAQLMTFVGNAVRILAPAYGAVTYARHGQWLIEGPGAQEFTLRDSKFAVDQASFTAMFRQNFIRHSQQGPEQAQAYLQMRLRETATAWDAVRWKIRATNLVNSDVMAELDSSIRRADIVKTTCDAGMAVGLCFVPGSWVAITAASAGYHLLCELVSGASGFSRSDMIGYVRDSAANAAQQTAVTGTTRAVVGPLQSYEKRLAQKLAQYSREGGSQLTRAQRARVAKFTRQAHKARRVSRAASRSFAAINLLFMKDDLARALGSLWTELTADQRSAWESQFQPQPR